MREITKEEAERAEHLEDCAGYDDCDCFCTRHSHADIYELQQEVQRQVKANAELKWRIAKMRNLMQRTVCELQVASSLKNGDIVTQYDEKG
jgi:hypothetical protein